MNKLYSKEQILEELTNILVEELEIDASLITLEAQLYEELELDSIDAVDIAVRMQKFSDKKISPEDFKKIRTINDVVEVIYEML